MSSTKTNLVWLFAFIVAGATSAAAMHVLLPKFIHDGPVGRDGPQAIATANPQQTEQDISFAIGQEFEKLSPAATVSAPRVERQPATREGPIDQTTKPKLTAEQVFQKTNPTTVKVIALSKNNEQLACGSGFVVGDGNLIATNQHVIEGVHRARVRYPDGRSAETLGVAAMDIDADLVILKMPDSGKPAKIEPLELASPHEANVGSRVYVLGSPLGDFENTLSEGIVSGIREPGTILDTPKLPRLIQITAPISKGSSGGPVINENGRVVGVATLSLTGGQNLNFAVTAEALQGLVVTARQAKRCKPLSASWQKPDSRVSPNDEWSSAEIASVKHFLDATRLTKEALAICAKSQSPWRPGQPAVILDRAGNPIDRTGKPWLLSDQEKADFVKLVKQADEHAHQVRPEVLKKMHPELPDAFKDFKTATAFMQSAPYMIRPHPAGINAWGRWTGWSSANGATVAIPLEARRK